MKWIFIIFPLMLWGCFNLNDCRHDDCFTPPPDIYFELVDSANGENLIQQGTLPESPIVITDEENSTVDCTLDKYSTGWMIRSSELGWKIGSHTYTLTVGDTLDVKFLLNMEIIDTKCCTFMNIKAFTIDNYSFAGSPEAGFIRVLVPVTGNVEAASQTR